MPREFDPLFGKPPCRYVDADCLPGCEHGYAGACERNKLAEEDNAWVDVTHIGSGYEIHWNPRENSYRHRLLSIEHDGLTDRRWGDREWTHGLPPGESSPCNDNVDDRLEGAMLTLEQSIQEVSIVVSDFRRSMIRLRRSIHFLFWVFVGLGAGLLVLGWTAMMPHGSLPSSG